MGDYVPVGNNTIHSVEFIGIIVTQFFEPLPIEGTYKLEECLLIWVPEEL